MIEHGSQVNAHCNDGETPLLMLMGRQDDDDVCEMPTLLLENWADPILQDGNGLTTLHCTVMGKKEELVLLRLEFEHSNKCDNFSLNQPAGPLCRSCRSAC